MKKRQFKAGGFTLIEIMLVVALVVIVGAISVPVYQSFQVKNDVDVAAHGVAQALKRAQILAQSGESDSVWGVHLENGKVIIFKGTDFIARDLSLDESFEISKNILLSGINEVVYSKLSGEAQQVGDVVLTTSTGETRILRINKKGMVEY